MTHDCVALTEKKVKTSFSMVDYLKKQNKLIFAV